jgi:hypothetical protein
VATEQPTGNNPDLVPTPPRGYPAPVPGRIGPRGPMIIAGIAGVVVGALLVGGAWLLFGNDGASSSPIAAPDRLSDYVPQDKSKVYDRNDDGRAVARRRADWDRRSGERLSVAHDGAGAVVRTYSDDTAENGFMLEVVRAPVAFPPYVPYTDAKTLGLDHPIEELRTFGDAACLVRNDPSQAYVMTCLRSDAGLTVQISHVSGDLLQSPEKVAGLVSDAWEELA